MNLDPATLEAIFKQGVGFVVAGVFIGLWWFERKDRKDAWKEYNGLLVQTITAIANFTTALTILESKTK